MDKATIIGNLREHERELKVPVSSISFCRLLRTGDGVREVSDADVLAEFSLGWRLSLLDMVAIENRLAEVLRRARIFPPEKDSSGPKKRCQVTAEPRNPRRHRYNRSVRAQPGFGGVSGRPKDDRRSGAQASPPYQLGVQCNVRGVGNWLVIGTTGWMSKRYGMRS